MLFEHLRKLETHQLFLFSSPRPSLLKSEILSPQPRYQSAFFHNAAHPSQTPLRSKTRSSRSVHSITPTPRIEPIFPLHRLPHHLHPHPSTPSSTDAYPLLTHIPRRRQPHKHRPPHPHNSQNTKTNNPRLPRTPSPLRSPPLPLQQPRPRLWIEPIIR